MHCICAGALPAAGQRAAAAAAAAAAPPAHGSALLARRPLHRLAAPAPSAGGSSGRGASSSLSARASSGNGNGSLPSEEPLAAASTKRPRGAGPPPAAQQPAGAAAPATLKEEAITSNKEVSDKLIDVFQAKQPAEWRKLIAYSKQWPMLAQGVLDRIEERAGEEADEEAARALRKLGRRLATVHEELSLYQQLIDKFRAAPSSDWEGMVSLHRSSMGQEFFKFLDLKIRASHESEQEQEGLLALAAQLAALVEAFDRVLQDEQAMETAAESFAGLLEVDSLEEADRRIDELAASGKLDPALLLMMAKAYAGSKETDYTREEVKDVMAHLYFKAKESFAQQAPKEVRILKYLLTIESERDRAELLASAFTPGAELEAGELDYLCTTPRELLNTIDNVLVLYDSSRARSTMAGDAASLMNPEVIERLRELQQQIRRQYL